VQILKGAGTAGPLSFEGEVFRVQNYWPAWARAPKPPIEVAANKPQMLRMAARLADGVMLSDLPPAICRERIGWVKGHLREFGREVVRFRLNNFLAWHVYDDAQRARREARQWLGYRGLFRRWVLTTFMSDTDYDIIEAHKAAIYGMVPAGTSSVRGVPDQLLDTCVDHLTLTGTPAEVPRFVAHLEAMRDAGLTDVTLELHEEPEAAIRLIGERVMPALRKSL
jgi:alkanesulfonate monooxygenase SsuD/methylene tetrahydromethanopterin reductase-like flavin-dependent oxidoreductase (luciferase family)